MQKFRAHRYNKQISFISEFLSELEDNVVNGIKLKEVTCIRKQVDKLTINTNDFIPRSIRRDEE